MAFTAHALPESARKYGMPIQPRAGHHARDTLNREKHQNHHCSQDAQQVGLGLKPIGEVVARPMSNQPLMSEALAGSAVTKLPRLRPPTMQSS